MKIRIDNQIHDIDEQTLLAWLRVGPIPAGTYVLSETLTDGQWRPIHELDLGTEQSQVHTPEELDSLEQEFEKEKQFLTYQRRRPIVTLTLIAVNTIVFILLDQFRGLSHGSSNLIQFGAYSYRLIVEDGEYWRLITNTFLHSGGFHFFLNMGILFILGNLLEGLYGRSRYLILYLVAAIGGSLASLLVSVQLTVGASGAIFGLMGVIVALGLRHKDRLPLHRGRVFGLRLLPFIALDVALGFIIPYINNAAHLGGLAVGFAAGLILPPVIYAEGKRESYGVRAVAAVFVGLTILSGAITTQHFFDPSKIAESRMNNALPSPADLPEYIERAEEVLRKRDYSRESYTILERLYWKALRNDPEEASWGQKLREFYERALLEDPDYPDWNNRLLGLYQLVVVEQEGERENLDDYIRLYEKVRRKKGYHHKPYQNLEYFYARGKMLNPQKTSEWDEKLEKLYREAVSEEPEHATWYNNLAWLYVEQKSNFEQAVELAQQAVKHDPKNTIMLDTLAWAYVQNGQYRRSLRAFEQVLSNSSETNEDQQARESSWKGIDKFVQTEIAPSKLEESVQAFRDFYDYLSHQFADQPVEQAKLEVAFDHFQEKYGN